jgi:hypothetical protein
MVVKVLRAKQGSARGKHWPEMQLSLNDLFSLLSSHNVAKWAQALSQNYKQYPTRL